MSTTVDFIQTASFTGSQTHRHHSLSASAAQVAGTAVMALLNWLDRARERRQLLALGDLALQDFGASRADAAHEGDKPFWRA